MTYYHTVACRYGDTERYVHRAREATIPDNQVPPVEQLYRHQANTTLPAIDEQGRFQ
jgi:hypothetical protein